MTMTLSETMIDTAARRFAKADPSLTYEQAMAKAIADDPALYARYAAEQEADAALKVFQESARPANEALPAAQRVVVQRIDTAARKLYQRDPKLTIEQARAKVIEEDPRMYSEYMRAVEIDHASRR